MSLESLYQEIILDHYKRPRNFGPLPDAALAVAHENPLCGDQLQLYVDVEGQRIKGICFHGRGCAISLASASMMTEQVKGQPTERVQQWIQDFLTFMRSEGELPEEEMEELVALQGVRQFPVRVKCATLAWNALQEALTNGRVSRGPAAHGEG